MAITKADVENWIKEIVPYVIHPVIIAPKGSMAKGLKETKPGSLLEYDTCLMPSKPEIIDKTSALKTLVGLYSLAEEDFLNDDEDNDIINILLSEGEDV